MLHIGILGAGFMGSTHARAFAQQDKVKVVAVSSRTATKAATLAREVGATPYTDGMALLQLPEVDAVSITLPTPLHAEYTIAALRVGKHVLVEKPMAMTLAECDAMMDAAQQSGRILMVAHVIHFWPEYVALADCLRSGQLGKPLMATATRLSTRPTWGEWFSDPQATGGAVYDLHIHDLDALHWLFGPARTLYARGQRGAAGGWDSVFTLADCGGVACCAEASHMLPDGYPFTMALRVLCERGCVEFHFRAAGTGVETGAASGTRLLVYEAGQPPRPLPVPAGDGYVNQIAHFVRCVREGRPPSEGTPAQGRAAAQMALAARQSLASGQIVHL